MLCLGKGNFYYYSYFIEVKRAEALKKSFYAKTAGTTEHVLRQNRGFYATIYESSF